MQLAFLVVLAYKLTFTNINGQRRDQNKKIAGIFAQPF
jgi:hypothetical protein